MLRRLSEHKLGIFMPHMHDEETGEFRPLPDDVMQVESGLIVSFQPTDEIANRTERFLPVGWFGKKNRAMQRATSNIRCLKDIRVVVHLLGRLQYVGKGARLIRQTRTQIV